MPITPAQIEGAERIQHLAAHDELQAVRVVAGPGTGKSSAVEERVRWLLDNGLNPNEIAVVSFTRASALDLRRRIHQFCLEGGQAQGDQVRVTTLHALALRILRMAGLLTTRYPAYPLVLDEWELEHIFDAEFGVVHGSTRPRSENIRREHEAYWSTGRWDPANYIPPIPPISPEERESFDLFHDFRTQAYSCVLPGELVRLCVMQMDAGVLDPVKILRVRDLIVDEYQDLNPVDLEFVDLVTSHGARVFVAGDDDQSVYSFRHASPSGIQSFPSKYSNSGLHTLSDCFRCTPSVLAAGQSVIEANPGPNRIEKNHSSLYVEAVPPLQGVVHRIIFQSEVAEVRAMASTCAALIQQGVPARDILVLVSNKKQLLPTIIREFESVGVPHETPRDEGFLDSRVGRFVLAALRIACDREDYVAHRVLLGLLPSVGPRISNSICEAVIANNLNYRNIFHDPVPSGVFQTRAATQLDRCREICAVVVGWNADDSLSSRSQGIEDLITNLYGFEASREWQEFSSALPTQTSLEELRNFLWADTGEQQVGLLGSIYARLDMELPAGGLLPERVRVMTMHGAKGLSAKVVFIPGLEEEIFPGPRRQPYPGLVLEAARLLYVSITRARAACILSYAESRLVFGTFRRGRAPSRFCAQTGGRFSPQNQGLSSTDIQHIVDESAQL